MKRIIFSQLKKTYFENVLREVCPLVGPAEADQVWVAEAVAQRAVLGLDVVAREQGHEGLCQPLLGAERHETALVAFVVLARSRVLQRGRQAHGARLGDHRQLGRPVHRPMPLRYRVAILTQVF